jgi:hypothetical protein
MGRELRRGGSPPPGKLLVHSVRASIGAAHFIVRTPAGGISPRRTLCTEVAVNPREVIDGHKQVFEGLILPAGLRGAVMSEIRG